jgi:DNA invertase Pin-like site-specific DNA recombinase
MMNNSDVINVAAYCRVSTDHTDQLHSLSAQIKYFTEYISQHEGYKLKEVYYDEGITGTSVKKRAGFNRMITDAENGEIDLILSKEVSRFARNTVDTLTYTRKLSALNVGVIFMNDGIDTRDKDGELRLSIMASIAQDESRKTSERVKWGMRRKMEDGYVFGYSKMLGFRINKGVLSIVPEEAEIVKRIFNDYFYGKKGTFTIATELNNDGVLTIKNKLWSSSTVMQILRNDKYVGDLTQMKTYITDYLTKESRINKGEVPMVYIRNHHEPIISRDVWDGVQQQIEERGLIAGKGNRHSMTYWFSGKISCGKCGKPYNASGGRSKETTIMRCRNRLKFGEEVRVVNGFTVGCDSGAVNHVVLNACMKHILEHIKIARESIVGDLLLEVQNMQTIDNKPADVTPLETEITNLSRKKREAIDLMLENLITKDDLKEQTAFYDSEIVRLTEEINDNRDMNAKHRRQLEEVKSFIGEVNKAADTDSDNTELYSELIRQIIVQKDGVVDFYLNCVPFGFRITYSTCVKTRSKIRIFCDIHSLSAIA